MNATAKQISYLLSLVRQANEAGTAINDRATGKAVQAARFGGLSKSAASAAIDYYRSVLAAA